MSTRTLIEINHDYLGRRSVEALRRDLDLLLMRLGSSDVTGALNAAHGAPVSFGSGIRILAQRHHSETLQLEVN